MLKKNRSGSYTFKLPTYLLFQFDQSIQSVIFDKNYKNAFHKAVLMDFRQKNILKLLDYSGKVVKFTLKPYELLALAPITSHFLIELDQESHNISDYLNYLKPQ